ncbi:MAG TPA: cellulase family glycosylhydrolase [Roseimicrobium sp.]|nr:cellulase family glycosylhydrolase [Roseimicrobium sp.]
MTRRHALGLIAAGTAATALAPRVLAQAAASPRPTMHVYDNYGWLRGFSVVPSWAARIEDAWWEYNPDRFRSEIAPARAMHANCIRLWIEFTAWMADPDKVTASFMDAVSAIDKAGMKTMPCLFNRWHDNRYDYGGTYLENIHKGWEGPLQYVKTLVTPLAKDDRILIWDLCNEPQSGAGWAKEMNVENSRKEHDWLAAIAKTVRESGAQQPITIGTMVGANIEAYADLCDVLCGHPYAHDRAGLEKLVTDFKALQQKYSKPFLVNECIPGAEIDRERGELALMYRDLLGNAGFGWMGWALREGKAISTRRDRVDANGLRKFGFHPFALKNGKLRDGLECLTETPKLLPPWQGAKK